MDADASRKREEKDLHDLLRGLDKSDPERYAYYMSNRKFYSVDGASQRYFYGWLAENAAGKQVLDYGSGAGHDTVFLGGVAKHVVGIDISPVSVERSIGRAAEAGVVDKVEVLVMDAENMSFPDDSFDVVCVNGVLHHLDLDRALGEIARVLRPGGSAIFREATADNPLIHAYRKRTPHLRTAWETEHLLTGSSAGVMRKYFGDVSVRFFHLAVLAAVPFRNTRVFEPLVAVLDAVDQVALSIPGVRRAAWIACFTVANPRS